MLLIGGESFFHFYDSYNDYMLSPTALTKICLLWRKSVWDSYYNCFDENLFEIIHAALLLFIVIVIIFSYLLIIFSIIFSCNWLEESDFFMFMTVIMITCFHVYDVIMLWRKTVLDNSWGIPTFYVEFLEIIHAIIHEALLLFWVFCKLRNCH